MAKNANLSVTSYPSIHKPFLYNPTFKTFDFATCQGLDHGYYSSKFGEVHTSKMVHSRILCDREKSTIYLFPKRCQHSIENLGIMHRCIANVFRKFRMSFNFHQLGSSTGFPKLFF